MIVGDVEQHRDVRPEAIDALELEGRDLHHDDPTRLRGRGPDRIRQRSTQIATDERGKVGGLRHRAEQAGHRALAVGAGDRDHGPREEPRSQLDLARDGHPRRLGGFELREGGDSRRDHDAVDSGEEGRVVATQMQLDAELAQLGDRLADLAGFAAVVAHHLGASRYE